MSAQNFHNVNASRIFAVATPEDFDVEYFQEDLSQALGELNGKNGWDWTRDIDKDPHELRSYPSTVLGALSDTKLYKNFSVEVHVIAVLRSGYYDGCNLDWYCRWFVEGQELDGYDLEYFAEAIEYESSTTEKNALRLAKFAHAWALKQQPLLVAEIEKIFDTYSTNKLICTGVASNGEAFYQEVK